MAKILSQEEVDALLSGFSREEAAAAAAPGTAKPGIVNPQKKKPVDKNKKVSIYNFRRPDRVRSEWLRTLHFLHQRLARIFSSSLSAYLRALIEVDLYSVEQLTYGAFIHSLPDPTYLSAIAMEPPEGNALLEINPKILFPLLDKILGGKGEDYSGGKRTLTDIERALTGEVVQLLLRDLQASWKPLIKTKMTIAAGETSPQLIRAAPPHEMIVLIVFELKIGDARGLMNFCIPSVVLESVFKRISPDRSALRVKPSAQEVKKIKKALQETKIRAEAGIYGNCIKVKDLLALAPGNVIKLDTKINDEIHIKLNGIKKFRAYQVKTGDKKALQIVDLIPGEINHDR